MTRQGNPRSVESINAGLLIPLQRNSSAAHKFINAMNIQLKPDNPTFIPR